jgi:hypothetical protein
MSEPNREPLIKPPQRKLLPDDVTLDELSWLLDNHSLFHKFVDMIVENTLAEYRRHHRWENQQ